MKWIGIVLLGLCPVMWGIQASRRLRKRTETLEIWTRMICAIRGYIRYEAVCLNELFHRISREDGFRSLCVSRLFSEDTRQIPTPARLCDALRKGAEEDGLAKEDESLLLDFLDGLGKTDVTGQTAHCELYEGLLKQRRLQAEEKCRTQQNLYQSLGLFAGIFLAVLFV